MSDRIAEKEYYSIGDVCEITDLKPHVLRYWESQFPVLRPQKNQAGNRVYRRKEIKLIQLLRHLLYGERYTIEGARHKLEQLRREGKLAKAARVAWDTETIRDLRREADELVQLLAGAADAGGR
ncbi:MAG: MerR family transcriptional regulator [Gemmatimonadota bacterium]